ncbi:ABC transporter substrate-binding protein [Aquabacter sp. CN5-332]|uniref:ABC transporter substrate-binding protein n=1 Tax=Aquabacter sp. CN5-332 TaxID=3156608 RepID=UPI0032B50165
MTVLSRRAALGVTFAAAFFAGGLLPASAQETVLKVGYLRTQGFIMDFPVEPVNIPGVKLELYPFETGNDVLEAVNAGRVDVGETGEPQPIFSQNAGRLVKIIAASAPARLTSLLVKEDSPIRTVADLKGRKISFVKGTNTHWLTLKALSKAGLTQADIQPVLLSSSEALPGLLSGQVDAIGLTAPTTQIALSRGARLLLDSEGLVNSSLYYLATPETIRTKEAALAGFVAALSKHMAWIPGHTQERVAYLAPKLGIPPNLLTEMAKILPSKLVPVGDSSLASYQQQLANAFADQGLVKPLDVREEFDGRFDKELTR